MKIIFSFIVINLTFIISCIPSVDQLGNANSSSLLTTNIPTNGILATIQPVSGSMSDYIDGVGLQINSSCNDGSSPKKEEIYNSIDQNLSFSLNTACNYELLMILGKYLNGTIASNQMYAYNINGIPAKITASELQTHTTNKPGQAFSLDIQLGFTVNAEGRLKLVSSSGTQPAQSNIPIPPPAQQSTINPSSPSLPSSPAQTVQEISLKVQNGGYDPSTLNIKAGQPVRLTVTRLEASSCGEEIVFPTLNKSAKLPLNQPVVIEFTGQQTGEMNFACGMNMYKGKILVQ